MKIINLLINEDVLKAEIALERAGSDDIVTLGRAYLASLREYREQLHGLGGIPDINLAEQSKLGRELVEQSRRAIRAAIEITVDGSKIVKHSGVTPPVLTVNACV